MLTVRNLVVNYGLTEVLKGISLDVNPGEVLVVAGANGSGKSSLLSAVHGLINPSSGSIVKTHPSVLLSQDTPTGKKSVLEFLLSINSRLAELYEIIDRETEDSRKYSDAVMKFTDLGGYQLQAELTRSVEKFGFDENELTRPIASFSEGQKQLFSIARVINNSAGLVLMDEPLNHLDIGTRVFLEEVVKKEKNKGQGFLIVTHDRVFADRVADRTLYVQRGQGVTVQGGMSMMIEHLELVFESRKKNAEDISRRIRKLEAEVSRRLKWSFQKEKTARKSRKLYDGAFLAAGAARMAKRAKATEKRKKRMIERLKSEKPFVEKKIHLAFDSYDVVDRRVIMTNRISKSFDLNHIFEDVSVSATAKDRIAIIGSNGSGKTTLLRCLLGELDVDKGDVRLSEHVNYMYLPQDVEKGFSHEILLNNLTGYGIDESIVRQYLGAAKIRKNKVLQPVSTLSRGELMRAWIVGAILAKVEFLFLDEPTNHLDIQSLAVLDQLLAQFPGGMLFVSHDRQFIANHARRVLSLDNGRLADYSF